MRYETAMKAIKVKKKNETKTEKSEMRNRVNEKSDDVIDEFECENVKLEIGVKQTKNVTFKLKKLNMNMNSIPHLCNSCRQLNHLIKNRRNNTEIIGVEWRSWN